ncbi:MAG TPA: tetratricopeptide repeat protein [Vicinamibacteria bacterium]|nr:tetratricopeptide repeat protein [Vicinamibacteria bacterium]
MNRAFFARCSVLTLGLAVTLAPPAPASRTTAGVRGRVVDEQGAGVPDVKIDMEFKGESRQKVTRSQTTDKKGGFVRMGIPDGPWTFTFTKEGYTPTVIEMHLSLGGFSEMGDVALEVAPVAAAVPAGPVEAVLPATPESNQAGETYMKAVEAAQAGRYDEAEPMLREILAEFPDLAAAHYNLGFIYQKKKDWKAAEAEYRRVTELQPEKSDAFVALSAVQRLDGRLDGALQGLIAAAPRFETDARFQYALGLTANDAGETAEADAAFKKAAELDPANPEPLYHRATIAVGQNRIAEAVGLLDTYLAMTGQVPENVQTAKGLLAALKKK